MDRNSVIKTVFSTVDSRQNEAFRLIRELCDINTITGNRDNILRSFNIIQDAITPLGFSASILEEESSYPIFIATNEVKNNTKKILLLAHVDTVPVGGKDQIIKLTEDENNFYGTGVLDMKSGIVEIIECLYSLKSANLLNSLPITILINSDEEIGSPLSRKYINESADESLFGFVFESSNEEREIVTSRVGKILYELIVEGVARHISKKDEEKTSAIEELAHKIIEIEKLNKVISDSIVNVGMVEGGLAPNVVPPYAKAKIDIRYINHWVKESVVKKLVEITKRNLKEKTVTHLNEINSRPPFLKSAINQPLVEIFQQNGSLLNLNLFEVNSFGASDGCFLSEKSIPVIDGIGPIGLYAHSKKEFMIKKSFALKTKLATLSMSDAYQSSSMESS